MVYKVLWVVSTPRCTVGPNTVGSCCIRFHTTAGPNNVGRAVQTDPALLGKRMQHLTPNNVRSCWPTVLRPFVRGFRSTTAETLQTALAKAKISRSFPFLLFFLFIFFFGSIINTFVLHFPFSTSVLLVHLNYKHFRQGYFKFSDDRSPYFSL